MTSKRMVAYWIYVLVCSLALMNAQVYAISNVTTTLLQSAVARGAVCLDGSPPAYYYQEGFGDGLDNWIVNIEGGGWCTSTSDCLDRSKNYYGSSRHLSNQIFSGILDDDIAFNPDFYNWHKVFIHYCDGSSFMSDVEKVNPKTNLTFRGARIFNVMMEEMLGKGMRNAHKAILVGTSAGGLTTTLHCDKFRALLRNTSTVKCLSDSGFFIHGKDHPGVDIREKIFANAIATHKLAHSLPKTCTSKINPSLCLFPEYLVEDVETPLFILESAFDSYQVKITLVPAVGGHEWVNCMTNLTLCDATQIAIMKDFRGAFIETLMKLDNSSSRGMFVHTCFRHGHIYLRDGWTCSSVAGNVLANKTIGEAIGDWYFDRSSFHEIYIQNDLPRNCTSSLPDQSFNKICLAALHHI
ncbi:hypothetical protein ACS0TY_006748 [Phlomoides rotata]